VTDYAINWFINAPPTDYQNFTLNPPRSGFAMGQASITGNGNWAAPQNRATVQGLADGSSNTILVGGKAVPPTIGNNNGVGMNGGDEGIFSPGTWNPPAAIISTGTARGHNVSAAPPQVNQSAPGTANNVGYPWMFRDTELATTGAVGFIRWTESFGGPFSGGVLFMFGDGTVRNVNYNQRGSVNFARMMYPSDGQVTNFD